MMCTKSDIALTMYKGHNYMSNLVKIYSEAMKWIIIYLKNSRNYVILFDNLLDNTKDLLDFVDVDYG